MKNVLMAILLGGSVATSVTAAEVKVLSGGAVEPGQRVIEPERQRLIEGEILLQGPRHF